MTDGPGDRIAVARRVRGSSGKECTSPQDRLSPDLLKVHRGGWACDYPSVCKEKSHASTAPADVPRPWPASGHPARVFGRHRWPAWRPAAPPDGRSGRPARGDARSSGRRAPAVEAPTAGGGGGPAPRPRGRSDARRAPPVVAAAGPDARGSAGGGRPPGALAPPPAVACARRRPRGRGERPGRDRVRRGAPRSGPPLDWAPRARAGGWPAHAAPALFCILGFPGTPSTRFPCAHRFCTVCVGLETHGPSPMTALGINH